MALLEKQNSGQGQVIDVSLVESMFNLMEAVVPEFDGAGVVRGPSGSTACTISIIPRIEEAFRNDEIQSGWSVSYQSASFVPVVFLR